MLDAASRARLLARYRFLFRMTIIGCALSVIAIATGAYHVITSSSINVLAWGVLLFALSGLSAYKYVLSTMKLLEADPGELQRWR